jgi:predicted PurR-regulated permease PerM
VKNHDDRGYTNQGRRLRAGQFITSVIAGLGTYFWLLAFGIPYPLLLGMFVALLDLIPVIGSTVGGVVVSTVTR